MDMATQHAPDLGGNAFIGSPSRFPEYVSSLERNGFLCVPDFASAADVQFINATLQKLLRDGTGFKEGARRDLEHALYREGGDRGKAPADPAATAHATRF